MNTNENDRLKNLKSYEILDTSIEDDFDKLARLASIICETPIALISFIDSDRQWFKSVIGLTDLKETSRNISFCNYAIKNNGVMEITDALLDERFMGNPYVVGDPNIRFYAGSPLRSPEGYNLGTICVIDDRPHKLSDEQLEALQILSNQVIELLVLRKTAKRLSDAQKLIEEQHDLLVNKARLQTIGELAGGICHQINNPLAIIAGRSMILRSQLKTKLPDDTDVQKELDVIDQTSERVSGILKALRTYAKDFGEEIYETRVSEIVDDALTLMKNKIVNSGIKLSYNKNSNSTANINKNQISQVVLDLLNNAVEAMEETSQKNLQVELRDVDNNIELTVTDSGSGISEEDQNKIFRPFFTTKSRHFGIGLSNARTYLRQHKGSIKLLHRKDPTIFQFSIPKCV